MSEAETKSQRGHRKEQVGIVISAKMDKTIIVQSERRIPHPRFRKVISRKAKFYAHDEKREAGKGDKVKIQETRPLSKLKCWRLMEVLEKNTEAIIADKE